jgi:hypothetical protein
MQQLAAQESASLGILHGSVGAGSQKMSYLVRLVSQKEAGWRHQQSLTREQDLDERFLLLPPSGGIAVQVSDA